MCLVVVIRIETLRAHEIAESDQKDEGKFHLLILV